MLIFSIPAVWRLIDRHADEARPAGGAMRPRASLRDRGILPGWILFDNHLFVH